MTEPSMASRVVTDRARNTVVRMIESGNAYTASQIASSSGVPISVVEEIARDVREARRARAVAPKQDSGSASLRYITASRLFIDTSYQTATDNKRIGMMAQSWRPDLVGVLEVNDRDTTGNAFAVIDGQHRWRASILAHPDGDQCKMLCHVHMGLTVAQEADIYHLLYTTQRKKTALELWRGRQASGDEDVAGIERVLGSFSLRSGPKLSVNMVKAVRVLDAIWKAGGEELLTTVLTSAVTAWSDQPDGLGGTHLHGLAIIHAGYGSRVQPATIGVALQKTTPSSLIGRARELRAIQRYSLPRAMAAVMVAEHNSRFRRANAIPELVIQVPLGISNVEGIPMRGFSGNQDGLDA